MIEEFKKSVNSILHERVTSPFWGAFIISWIVCNWEVLYLTIFISDDKISINKLDYINQKLDLNVYSLILIPLLLTFCILAILPFISNGAYWIYLKFHNWRVLKKREVESTVTLTLKESLELRNEILKQEERFQKLNIEKDERIINLNNQNNKLQESLDKQRELLKQKEDSLESYSKRIERHNERHNYSKVFSGEWSYEIKGRRKKMVRMYNDNEITFDEKYKNKSYRITTIYRNGNSNFLIFLGLKENNVDNISDFKLLNLQRSQENIDDYEGVEISFNKDDNENQSQEIHEIALKKK